MKWTEPLALMLALVEQESQAVRVVRLALEVDLKLGARLAGAVKPKFQERTVALVAGLKIPQQLKIRLLGLTRSGSAISYLQKYLEGKEPGICESVTDALGRIGNQAAISLLHQALTDKNPDVRIGAVEGLSQIGSDAAVSVLSLALLDKYAPISGSAVQALVRIGSDAAMVALRRSQSDPDADSYVRNKITGILGYNVSEDMIPALLQDVADENFLVRSEAVGKLGSIASDSVIPVLCQALKDECSWVRANAVNELGKIDSEAVVPALCEALADEDASVQLGATSSLGKFKSETVVSALTQALKHEKSNVRVSAANGLRLIGSGVAIPDLLQSVKDIDSRVRASAVHALEEIGSEVAVPDLLRSATEDINSKVRASAVHALGKIGNETTIPTLIQALKDADSDIRFSAASALGQIGGEMAIAALNQAVVEELDRRVRYSAVEALGQIGSEAVIPTLCQALTDKDVDVRVNAVQALGRIGSETTIPGLRKALKDINFDVRANAASALGKVGSETAIYDLCQVLLNEDEQPWVRVSVATALGEIGSEAAISALQQASKDKDSDIHYSAFDALGAIGSPLLLSLLTQNLQQSGEIYLFKVITAIQERCKFYNYTLAQTQPISVPLIYILHLSDLHFGTPDNAQQWYTQLAADLQELNCTRLDAVILSGDIANKSIPEEYDAAKQFLDKLAKKFNLKSDRIVIVPGNHDLNWGLAEEAYTPVRRKSYKGSLNENHIIDKDEYIEVQNLEQYKQRFANFSKFYQDIKEEPYPLEYEQQGILHHLPEQNLLILGLNSAWQLDHYYKSRASIHPIALSKALEKIDENYTIYEKCLKIAVWHHPLDSAFPDRITDHGFMEQLAVAGFRLFLHGHIHKAETSLYRYDLTANGRKLDRICAGTFGAPVHEWVSGYPLQYNLLKLEGNKLTVETRRREELNGAWKPDAQWSQGAVKDPLPRYEIQL